MWQIHIKEKYSQKLWDVAKCFTKFNSLKDVSTPLTNAKPHTAEILGYRLTLRIVLLVRFLNSFFFLSFLTLPTYRVSIWGSPVEWLSGFLQPPALTFSHFFLIAQQVSTPSRPDLAHRASFPWFPPETTSRLRRHSEQSFTLSRLESVPP